MKALHVIQAVAPRYGGPSTSIWPLVEALNRVPGVSAEIAATDADGPGGRVDRAALPAGAPLHLFRRTFSEQWKYSAGLGRWLRANARRFDVVHVHGVWAYPNKAAARAAGRAGVPYVVRPAGMFSDYCLNVKAMKKRLYWALVEGRTVGRATAFHCTGDDEVRDAKAVRPDAETFLIPQGVDADAFDAPADPGALAALCGPAAAGRPVVLFLGRLHPVKGVADLLLPAFARLRSDACLALAGGPDSSAPGYEGVVRGGIERLGLGGRVAMLGAVKSADRWRLFDGAAAFVLPSHSENFGMVVAEAMARGRPVVVTEGVQSKAQVLAAGGGRVVPFDPDALAAALDALLSDPAAADERGAAGRRYVRDELTWGRAAERVVGMYHAVAGRTGR